MSKETCWRGQVGRKQPSVTCFRCRSGCGGLEHLPLPAVRRLGRVEGCGGCSGQSTFRRLNGRWGDHVGPKGGGNPLLSRSIICVLVDKKKNKFDKRTL